MAAKCERKESPETPGKRSSHTIASCFSPNRDIHTKCVSPKTSAKLAKLVIASGCTGADGPRAIRLGHLDVRCTSWYYFKRIVMEGPWNLQSPSRVRRRSRRLF